MRFPGVAQLSDGASAELDIALSSTQVEIYVGDELVEVWSTPDVVFEGEGRFRIRGEGESFVFAPADPEAFGASAAARPASVSDRIKSLATVDEPPKAATPDQPATFLPSGAGAPPQGGDHEPEGSAPEVDRPEVDRPEVDGPDAEAPAVEAAAPEVLAAPVLPRAEPSPQATARALLPDGFTTEAPIVASRSMLPVILAVVGTIIVVVIGLVIASAFFGDADEDGSVGAQAAGPGSSTTATVSPAGVVFSAPASDLVDAWNAVARPVSDDLVLVPSGPGEASISPYARVEWAGEPGRLARYQVVIDPSGPQAADERAIAALGVAVAVADPSLDGPGRRELLDRLGLDVSDPRLGEVDSELDQNGVRYSLRYVPAFQALLFTVAPAG